MTKLLLVRTSNDEVLGSITLSADGAAIVEGEAMSVWRTMRRKASSDRELFETLADGGWSNGPVAFRPTPE